LSKINAGCCGWPVARSRYFQRFSTLEITSSFYRLPRVSTGERWRKEAPKDFVFALRSWQRITHPGTSPTYERLGGKMSDRTRARLGHFKPSDEVASAWEDTLAVARALEAGFILFQTPASFYPNADHLRDMYRFFRGLKRGGAIFVWEPRGESWTPELVRKVCRDLDLVHATDPFKSQPLHGSVRYFRLHGKRGEIGSVYEPEYTQEQLRQIPGFCDGKPSYVYFNNRSMWADANQFQQSLGSKMFVGA